MQTTEHLEVSAYTIQQIRELLKTIVEAANTLAKLLPDTELKQRFYSPLSVLTISYDRTKLKC